jgi:deazaflavin-dependent oxidoreductase (nitroreductase family)
MSDFTVPVHLPEWITSHVKLYLESGGKEGHMWDSTVVGGPGMLPTLLLVTKGRKSGKKYTLPLIYGKTGDGSYVVIGSRGGTPTHPDWYLNLKADPHVKVQVGTERFDAVASTVPAGPERDALWKQLAGIYPPYDDYQARTGGREIPVVVLKPEGKRVTA